MLIVLQGNSFVVYLLLAILGASISGSCTLLRHDPMNPELWPDNQLGVLTPPSQKKEESWWWTLYTHVQIQYSSNTNNYFHALSITLPCSGSESCKCKCCRGWWNHGSWGFRRQAAIFTLGKKTPPESENNFPLIQATYMDESLDNHEDIVSWVKKSTR